MLNLQRLDQAAASKNKRRQFDVLLTVTAPHERAVFTVTLLLMLALLAWMLFADIEHEVLIDGVLIEPGPRYEVVSVEQGHLVEFFVFPGDPVKAGDPIARQSVPVLDRETAMLRRQIDLLEMESTQADKYNASTPPPLEAARAALLAMEARRTAREMIVTHVGGEVVALHSAPGKFVPAGVSVARVRKGDADAKASQIQAVLRVVPGIAHRIRVGMQAKVDVARPDSSTQTLQGEVIAVTAGPLPKWLATMQPALEGSLHRIDIMLHQVPEHPVPDGAVCQVRIRHGEGSPIGLLVPNLF